ncbi:hypothetical protein NL676_035926 [Syzygium grande]|nr:hypothetical protein NL676_035926 [Syzygium grande]
MSPEFIAGRRARGWRNVQVPGQGDTLSSSFIRGQEQPEISGSGYVRDSKEILIVINGPARNINMKVTSNVLESVSPV